MPVTDNNSPCNTPDTRLERAVKNDKQDSPQLRRLEHFRFPQQAVHSRNIRPGSGKTIGSNRNLPLMTCQDQVTANPPAVLHSCMQCQHSSAKALDLFIYFIITSPSPGS